MDLGITYTVGADGTKVMSLPDETRERVLAFIRETALNSPLEIEAVVQEGSANCSVRSKASRRRRRPTNRALKTGRSSS